jgi:hypothetical protein
VGGEKKQGKAHNIQRSGRNRAKRLYERQLYRTEQNRKKRWARHKKNHPNDQAASYCFDHKNPIDKKEK